MAPWQIIKHYGGPDVNGYFVESQFDLHGIHFLGVSNVADNEYEAKFWKS